MTPPTLSQVSPNAPKTPLHSFRCDDGRWNAAKQKARDNGETIADVLRRALDLYLEPGLVELSTDDQVTVATAIALAVEKTTDAGEREPVWGGGRPVDELRQLILKAESVVVIRGRQA